jgi:hypothetical protein
MPADGDLALDLLRTAECSARRHRDRRGHAAICDEFEFYGWRRVRAETRIFLLTGFAGVGLFSLGAELQIAQNGSISEGYGPTYRSHQNPRMGRAGAFATCLMDGCAARRLPD